MSAGTLKARLAAGELVLCMGLRQARTPDIVLVAAAAGFDAVYVDMEHSPVSFETTSMLTIAAQGAGIGGLVRIAGHDPHAVGRALDGGASGIIFPGVDTAEQAQAAVAACLYPPAGFRGVAGSGPLQGYRPTPLGTVIREANAAMLVVAMIETPAAVGNAHALAAVPGLDMLLIGSNDLCTAMGIPGEITHPRLREAYVAVAAACRAHGKVLGVGGIRNQPALQADLIAMGARFVIGGNDVAYLAGAAQRDVEALRACRKT